MSRTTLPDRWLGDFRRSLAFLRPHRRPLLLGLLAALGVSVFYTFSLSSVIPILKVMFSDHETLVDWLHRAETERRLGVAIAADLPDDPAGLLIDRVRPESPAAEQLADGWRIVAIGDREPGAHALMEQIATYAGKRLERVRIRGPDGATRETSLELLPPRAWWGVVRNVAALLPAGKDPASRLTSLAAVMVTLVLVSLLAALCRMANEGLVATAVQRAMHDLRCRLADHVLALPVAWHATQATGDTLGRFSNDLSKVEVGIWTLFGKAIREPLKAVGVLALTILIEWRLLIVALIGLPIGALVIRMFGRMVKRAQRRASQSLGRLLDHLGERLGGIRIVKAYNMQPAEGRRFEQEGRTLRRAQTHIELVDAATKPTLETLAIVAVAGFVIYGGSRVFAGELEPHLFFAAVVCLAGMFDPVRKMGNVNNRIQAADAAARRVFELIDRPAEEAPSPAEPALPCATALEQRSPAALPCATALEQCSPVGGEVSATPSFNEAVEFQDVSFAYPSDPDRLVLERVSFRVEKGQVVALVGPNGSGKTTLTALLLRFFEPLSGRIRIDGRDIAQLPLAALRARFGLVTQEAVIFSGTVRENIAYGDGDFSDERVRAAARLAHIDDFVSDLEVEHEGRVTRGYDAHVTDRTLSGGQRQRIALARAMLRNPPILILDEATSQVDSESERKIQEALEDVTRDRTTFIIAHRFSTIRRADRVVVLNEGCVVGVGTHQELRATCPSYVTLCETQLVGG